jgi:hypothetical protein
MVAIVTILRRYYLTQVHGSCVMRRRRYLVMLLPSCMTSNQVMADERAQQVGSN